MNYEWAESTLKDYMERVGACQKLTVLTRERRAALKILNGLASQVNAVLRSLHPDHGVISGTPLASHTSALPMVREALLLISGTRLMEYAKDEDDGEPRMPMRLLDPLVYYPARGHWDSGHYRSAVSDAATNVINYAQKRLGRTDLSDKKLMAEAFTDKPPETGKPRLRCPGNPANETVSSQQHGAMLLAMGCYEAIRNPAHHLTGDWNPVTAFEHLAVLSMVAKRVRLWNVEKYVEPMSDFSSLTPEQQKAVIASIASKAIIAIPSAAQPEKA